MSTWQIGQATALCSPAYLTCSIGISIALAILLPSLCALWIYSSRMVTVTRPAAEIDLHLVDNIAGVLHEDIEALQTKRSPFRFAAADCYNAADPGL